MADMGNRSETRWIAEIKITFYINDGENDGENIDINAKSMEIILKKQSAKLLVYSFTHFWIDFACA